MTTSDETRQRRDLGRAPATRQWLRRSAKVYDDGRIRIFHGDTLEILGSIEDSVDAVVTDPPYASGTRKEAGRSSSGAMVRGERFGSSPIDLDQMTTTGFAWLIRTVALDAYDRLPDGGSFISFIDWRQWPTLVGVMETCNYRVQNMVVWDKAAMGMGNGFRNCHELALHACKGTPNVFHRGTGNVLRYKRDRQTDHPSPKPVELMADLLRVVVPPDGIVLDPPENSSSHRSRGGRVTHKRTNGHSGGSSA